MDEEQIPQGTIAPTEVERAPDLIRKAKFEVGKTDVLICGKCHKAFYHIEEFQQHRSEDKCTQDSILRENERVEPKEQIWAFTLWKNGVLDSGVKRTEPLTSWNLYKRWSALSESEKEAWVIAGQNLQMFTKLSMSKLQEVKSRTPAAAKRAKSNSSLFTEKSNTLATSSKSKDILEEGEVRLSQLTDSQRATIRAQIAVASKANKENPTTEIKKVPLQLAQLYTDLIKKPPELRRALRTGKNDLTEETVFEKVLSRRFNHKSKCLEYFVKWDNMKESENTWEPRTHFEKCKQIMDEFDKVFNTSKIIPKAVDSHESESETTSSRPARSSKQKAKDQVKSWCDSMSDDDEAASKRKLFNNDDDSSDSFEKRMKMEEESDSSEDERRVKKSKGMPLSVNGITKKSGDNLAPQRIVRVSQKHMPNLSSGVYIMSKTEGIIKLNSDTPASNSSPLLKIGHRIGQTQVRMVKRDVSKSPVKILPKPLKVDAVSILPQQVPQPAAKATALVVEQASASPEKPASDEDSDGLSELEFPTDVPLPEPDSPPGDFILDPLTGKIAGQEYIDEFKDELELKPRCELDTIKPETTSLDTLVKQAVTDLSSFVDDVINDDKTPIAAKVESLTSEALSGDSDIPPSITFYSPPISIKSEPSTVIKTEIQSIPSTSNNFKGTEIDLEAAIMVTAIEKSAPSIKPKPKSESGGTSILNAALTNSKPQQKKLLSATPNTIRQKVAPYSHQMRMPTPSTTIIHKVSSRPKPFPQRSSLQDPIVRRSPNVNTYRPASSIARRIGNTTIYKTGSKSQTTQPLLKTQSVYKQQPVMSRVSSTSLTTGPISMPLIGIDDEPESLPSTSSAITDQTDTDLLPNLTTDLPTINLADSESPFVITGEDGTVYQVAGQNDEGQTILISEGPDGQQQCVIVTTEATADEEPSPSLLINNTPEPQEQQQQECLDETKIDIDEPDTDNEPSEDSQVVAQIVKADPPSPGGTRKVVLMLPDGNLMMTDVTAEQYAALELDK